MVQPKYGVSEMYTMSVLCIVLCALCLPFLVFGQDTCSCDLIGNRCNFTNKVIHATKKYLENVALGKPSSMTSTFEDFRPGYVPYVDKQACLANNGIRDRNIGFYFENRSRANCIHTGENDATPMWSVNLLARYTIEEMTIYTRNKFRYRMVGIEVKVDNKLCLRIEAQPAEVFYFKCQTKLTGQNVSISRSVPVDTPLVNDHTINICEVEVWICKAGYYGEECKLRCTGCVRYCNPDGSCATKECAPGSYGPGCKLTCGACKGGSCAAATGRCPRGCEEGWLGETCTQADTDMTITLVTIFGVFAILVMLLLILLSDTKIPKKEKKTLKEPDIENPPEEELKPPEEEGEHPAEEGEPPAEEGEPPEEGTEPPEEGTEPPEVPEENVVEEDENEKKEE